MLRRFVSSFVNSIVNRGLLFGSAILFALALNGAEPSSDSAFGEHLASSHGITKNVAAIMAREQAQEDQKSSQARGIKPISHGHAIIRVQNPNSPLTASWPAAGAAVAGPLIPQAVGTNFLGAQASDSGFVPPDSMADVGPSQILVCVNGRIRTFNKNGATDGALDTTTDNFFSSVLGGSSTSDPRVRFDRLTGRWFVTMITVNTPNFVLVAVSSGPVISSASSFTFFSFQADPTNFGDYDTLGVDAHALYVGVNIFRGNTFLNTTAFVINKSNLFSGTLTVTTFSSLISGRHTAHGPFTPQGVNNDDPAANEGYFIGVDAGEFGTLIVRRISNPGGTPTISGNIFVTVPTTVNPMGGVPALGTTTSLDDLDDRLFATRMHKKSLWTAHNIQVDGTGTANSSGGRDGSRWYQLTNMTTTPTLVQSGTLFDSAGSNPRNFWIPSCAMSGQGHMALGCSVAGVNEHAEIATAGRFASDPSGTIQSPTTAVTSSSTYNVSDGATPHRWGDFSVTTVDPSDDMTMWTVQEYCNVNNSWGVQVVQLKAPPPALPVNCNPAVVTNGVTNLNVIVTGTSTSSSGFFDPGSGFPNHISAAVNGGGVTVNSVTFNNPTNITLNISVVGGASTGARTVAVTNPDNQTATSSSGILTLVSPVTNIPPTLAAISNRTMAVGMTLIITNTASDPDGDQLTFSLGNGAATNAVINPTNGIFSWPPVQSQIGTNTFDVIVTDNGFLPLSATQTFLVTVVPSNNPPVLSPIADRFIHANTTLVITNAATDPDSPPETLTFSLGTNAPSGAVIDSSSGIFTWTPGGAFINTTNPITVTVTDNGLPPLSDSKTFSVIVEPHPSFLLPALSNTTLTLTWSSISGQTYQVQYNSDLTTANWTNLPPPVAATNITASVTDDTTAAPMRFYRVVVLP